MIQEDDEGTAVASHHECAPPRGTATQGNTSVEIKVPSTSSAERAQVPLRPPVVQVSWPAAEPSSAPALTLDGRRSRLTGPSCTGTSPPRHVIADFSG